MFNGGESSGAATPSEVSSATPFEASSQPVEGSSSATPTETPFSTSSPESSTSAPDLANSNFTNPVEDFAKNSEDLSDLLTNIPESIGYLKAIGLDYGFGPTQLMEYILEHIHIWTGAPWWASIILTGFAVRAVLFKAYVMAADNSAKLAAVAPTTAPLQEKMKQAMKDQDQNASLEVRRDIQQIYKNANIKLSRSFVPLLQIPLGYGIWRLLRGMAALPVPGMQTGGILWFKDLTICDPYYILPIVTAGMFHLIVRSGGETVMTGQNASFARNSFFLYFMPAMTFLGTWWFPAGAQLSFFAMSLISGIQVLLFRNPSVRRYLNITPLPETSKPSSSSSSGPAIKIRGSPEMSPKYKTLILGQVKPAPKGMNTIKYEQARGALASGAFLEARKLYKEATNNIEKKPMPVTISFARSPSTTSPPPPSPSSEEQEAAPIPPRSWTGQIKKGLRQGIEQNAAPIANWAKDRTEGAAKRQEKSRLEKFEAKRREEEQMRRNAQKSVRREERARGRKRDS